MLNPVSEQKRVVVAEGEAILLNPIEGALTGVVDDTTVDGRIVSSPIVEGGTVSVEIAEGGFDDWDTNTVRRRRAWIGVCVAATSTFLFVTDSAIVALALPRIAQRFPNTPRSLLAWVATGFMVANSSFLLVGGRIGDQRGRKRAYQFGLTLFSLGALLTALAPSLKLLIAARVIQGIGAAFLTSSALALVLPLFPRYKAAIVVGAWGSVGSIASWLTPTAGALVVERNWRWGFALMAPIGLLALFAGRNVLEEQVGEQSGSRTDWSGFVLGPPALGTLMLVVSRGRDWGWTSRSTIGLAFVSILLLAAFVWRCATVDVPLLDLRLFANRRYSVNVLTGAMQQFGYFSWLLTAPLVMTSMWGWSIRKAGFAIAVGQFFCSVGSPAGGRLVERWSTSAVIAWGGVVTGTGAMLWTVGAAAKPNFWITYLPGAVLFGFGSAVCGTVTTAASLKALPQSSLGTGNSVQQLIRRLGGAIGISLAIPLLGTATGAALLPGAKRVWLICALFHYAMVIPMLFIINRTRSQHQ
jgi:EmrB/QacA subfamily drug resistance transporter